MATNFRISSLPQDQQSALTQFISQYIPQDFHQQALDSIEKTGTLSPDFFQKINASDTSKKAILDQLKPIISALPSTQDAYNKVIGTNVDEANLTDQQLRDRLDAYTGLNNSKSGINRDQVLQQITSMMAGMDVKGRKKIKPMGYGDITNEPVAGAKENIANLLTDFTIQNGRLPGPGELRDLANSKGLPGQDYISDSALSNFLSSGDNQQRIELNVLPQTQNTTNDISRVQGLISDRANVATQNQKVNDFLNTAPGQLDAERTSFFNSQRNQAKDYITGQYAPQVAEQLAGHRGLGDSGQVGASVASKYNDLLTGIDASQLDQMNQDAQYFADQSYNKTFSDLVNARTDVSNTVATSRNQLLTNQAQSFSKKQADIENQFNLDLFKQQSQSAYNTYQNQVMKERNQARDSANAGTAAQVGQAVTTIGAAALL